MRDQRQTHALPRPAQRRFAHAWPTYAVVALALLFIVPGITGHDPWKQDETYVMGIVHHILQTGDWVVPQFAGEPFVEKPPLYYAVAATTAKLSAPLLPEHDGARLASALLFLLALLCTGLTGRELALPRAGVWAALALIGCVGLFDVHALCTDVALLAGTALALYGVVLATRAPIVAAALLGTGAGAAFLSKGLLVPAALSSTCLLLPLLHPPWRSRCYVAWLALAFVVALPWFTVWPILLYLRSPDLFRDWFWLNNVGRFVGFATPVLGAEHETFHWLKHLPWYTLPALPLALYGVRRMPHAYLDPRLLAPSLFALSLAALLVAAASARPVYALPLLPALAVLAVPGATCLSPAPARQWRRTSVLLFGAGAAALWTAWWALSEPSRHHYVRWLARYLPLDYSAPQRPWAVAFAACITLGWIVLARLRVKAPQHALVVWTAGLVLVNALLFALLLPWLDAAKTYRPTFGSLTSALPTSRPCISSQALGESERALLEYEAGIVTWRQETHPEHQCDLLLIEARDATSLPAGDEVVWCSQAVPYRAQRLWLLRRPVTAARAVTPVAARSPLQPRALR